MEESKHQFQNRKKAHIRVSLLESVQAQQQRDFNQIKLIHEALPDCNLNHIHIDRCFLGYQAMTPFYISSMTAGHPAGINLNIRLAKVAQHRGWMMGVGSQRRELYDSTTKLEWIKVRKSAPKAFLIGNIGIAQVISHPIDHILSLIDSLEAGALFVHLNPLQEALQPEGTPYFQGGLKSLERLAQKLPVPLLVKEVGCGISASTAQRLFNAGVKVIDVAGLGGTHWGRVEGLRAKKSNTKKNQFFFQVSEAFWDWGISTVESLIQIKKTNVSCQIWASGGVRNGVDAAKLLALGAQAVGFAQPVLKAALKGEKELNQWMEVIETQLKISLLITGCSSLDDLDEGKVTYGYNK